MHRTVETIATAGRPPLREQIADAVRNEAVPLSRLLRLMWALDAEPDPANENLRVQLRARIGAHRAV